MEAMNLSFNTVNNKHIVGAIQNSELQVFELQQKISETAYKGDNLMLIGDAVGNAHWSVGGGMQIGAISHAEKLKHLLFELDNCIEKSIALQHYSNYVLQDSQKWGEVGIIDFYPNIPPELVKQAYNDSLASWRKNKDQTPLIISEKLLQLNTEPTLRRSH
jgi:flavin-dependent dehydrogenase